MNRPLLALLLLAPLPLQAQEVRLEKLTWKIDAACPGKGADDLLSFTLTPDPTLGPWPEWSVEVGRQTTPLSCPVWMESWGVAGGQTSFRIHLSTEIHKAVRLRVAWEGGSKDWILTPPGGGDPCFKDTPLEAPVCQGE